ncbi:MAG: wax ester/triacylglycerol synthase family O-acyltransferase [Candidatus Binatia bacterium]
MSFAHYDRLTALDATFLDIEDPGVHMHVGAVAVFEGEPLRTAEGAIDIERIRAYTASALHEAPRFRQKVARVPFVGQPVWVDDPRFNLSYHVRHTALPPPGSIRQLKRLAGRIFSQKLDRGKPLWEMWVVEGLEDGRFGLIVKAHHCMADGLAGLDLLAVILRLEPDTAIENGDRQWVPRPRPAGGRLLTDEVWRRATWPLSAMREVPSALLHPRQSAAALADSVRALAETFSAGLVPTTDTPLNVEIGPYRRYDWVSFPIAEVRAVREALGGSLNDVVLATVAGAVGRFLRRRGETINAASVFRVMVPVSIRAGDERGSAGNRVVNFLAALPIEETDPARRVERIMETMRRLKRSRLVHGAELIEDISDHSFTTLLVQFVKLAAQTRAYNMVVTNVPGPPVPIYLLGARMEEIYPLVPLFSGQGLGVALFSYDGTLSWGFNADWDALPDLHDFVEGVELEFSRLRKAADAARTTAKHSPA